MRGWATDANDEACVNEVIGIDIAATMERRILEGLAEANAHSQRSLYENSSHMGRSAMSYDRAVHRCTQEDSLSQSERNKLLMEACGYDCTTALEANVLETEPTHVAARRIWRLLTKA